MLPVKKEYPAAVADFLARYEEVSLPHMHEVGHGTELEGYGPCLRYEKPVCRLSVDGKVYQVWDSCYWRDNELLLRHVVADRIIDLEEYNPICRNCGADNGPDGVKLTWYGSCHKCETSYVYDLEYGG